jgi:hypothetical protein
MKTNLKQICKQTNKVCTVYFTTMPISLFQRSERSGNFAVNGVALGLIRCKKMFWMANMLVFFICIKHCHSYFNLFIVKWLILCICGAIYKESLTKTLHLTEMLEETKIGF